MAAAAGHIAAALVEGRTACPVEDRSLVEDRNLEEDRCDTKSVGLRRMAMQKLLTTPVAGTEAHRRSSLGLTCRS